ncbi:MAG: phytanoyl-CoA dioxygenase family protein [Acidimicrobiales bacterium]
MTALSDQLGDKAFWRSFAPTLTVSDVPSRDWEPPGPPGGDAAASAARSLADHGYFTCREVVRPDLCARVGEVVARLVDAGIPTPFVFVYDEVWELLHQAGAVVARLLGPGFLVGGDLWAWHVAPNVGAAGWSVHRDTNLGSGRLHDGRTGLLTMWIPLTEATADNGCIRLLPADVDPHVPDDLGSLAMDAAARAAVVAVPATPGDVLGWTTEVLHWGGESTGRARGPRISVSIYAQRADAPPFADDFVPLDGAIPLHHRLGLVARALLAYEHSGLAGTALSEEVHDFAERERTRFASWLAMMAQLAGSGAARPTREV